MNLKLLILSGAMTLAAQQISAQFLATDAFPNPTGISNQGTIVGYDAQSGPYYTWNPDNGVVDNIGGVAPGNNHGGLAVFSDDGKYISGTSLNTKSPVMGEMSRYNTETKEWRTLGGNGDYIGSTLDASGGYYISGDGKTVAGIAYNVNKQAIGFAWNEEKGILPLPSANPNKNARANAVSADGSVIVGWRDTNGPWKSAVWTRNPDGTYQTNKFLLVNPNGSDTDPYNQLGEARAVSGDGKWIGGRSDFAFPNAWIWSQETGVVDLGTLTTDPGTSAWVTSFNYDGSVVLGYSITKADPFSAPVYRPFIWTKSEGMKDLNDYVKNVLKMNTDGYDIFVPSMITPNSKFILGWAVPQNPSSKIKVFRIQLPENFLANQEVKQTSKASLYPNPVTDVLKIDSDTNVDSVTIYNLAGQVVFSSKMNAKNTSINTAKYQAGVYMVAVKSGANTTTYKVIKK